ncbi:MAG: DUF5692 family protein [Microbacterium sp.]
MFLFESIPWYAWAAWFAVLAALILLNEITRRSKWVGIGVFVALPIVLTIFVWPTTAGEGSATGSWFHWVKVYSALVGVLGFMAIRHPEARREQVGVAVPRDPRDQHPRSVHPRLPGRRDGRRRHGRRGLHGLGPLELHERHRRHHQPHHHLRLDGHHRLARQLTRHGVARRMLWFWIIAYEPLELRLRLQLRQRLPPSTPVRRTAISCTIAFFLERRAPGCSTAPRPSRSG